MVGSDADILKTGSASNIRMAEYGKLFDSLDIIILSKKTDINKIQISDNVFAYSTNSKNKILALFDAYKIAKTLKKPDFVSSQDPFETGLLSLKIAQYFKTKLQLQIHTDFLSPYFKKESQKNKIRVQIAKRLLKKADGIRVVSESIKNSLLNSKFITHNSQILVLPIFVDVQKIKDAQIKISLREKYSQFDFIILMASRLTKEKNITLAIRALKNIIAKYPKTGLVLAGDGPKREDLEREVRELNLDENIKIEGWSMDLASYYKTADLFLLTSDYEGYGRTIIESLAAGTPVVSTDVGCAKEAGAILTEHDSEDIAKKIIDFIENPKKTDFKYQYLKKEDYLEKFKNQFN